MKTLRLLRAPATALAIGLVITGCAQSSRTADTTSSTTTSAATASTLATAMASATSASGTLLCTPAQAQVDACASLAAGAACTLTATSTATDGSTTTTTTAGTCVTSLDGATVACAPNPQAPPQALVDACASKALGDPCTATEPDGDTHTGTCVTARDGATTICGRAHTPPQVAIDACSAKATGDACTMSRTLPDSSSATATGVCALGPGSTGVLACAPAQSLRPSATSACTGLAAGTTCTIGDRDHTTTGTCVVPAAGGDAVCLAACGDLGGGFRCDGGREGGGGMPGGHGHGPGHH